MAEDISLSVPKRWGGSDVQIHREIVTLEKEESRNRGDDAGCVDTEACHHDRVSVYLKRRVRVQLLYVRLHFSRVSDERKGAVNEVLMVNCNVDKITSIKPAATTTTTTTTTTVTCLGRLKQSIPEQRH